MRLLAIGLVFFVAQVAAAADHGAALKPYLTDDVVAVAYLDLSAIDAPGVLEWAEKLGLVSEEERDEAEKRVKIVQEQLGELVNSGASHLYLLLRVSDVSDGGPSWVVPVGEGGSPRAVLGLMVGVFSGGPGRLEMDALKLNAATQPPWLPRSWEVVDGAVLGSTTKAQLEHMKNTRPKSPRDLSDAWAALGQGDCGLVIFGDADSRRVVREMFPPLPAPFAEINGKLLAEGLLWGGIALKLPPQPDAEIVVETRDEQTATTVAQVITSGLILAKHALPVEQELIEALASAFRPQVEGARVRIALDELTSDVDRLTKLLSPPVRKARQAAWRNARVNQFKNIALAFHNYADRNKGTFPAHANYDDNGKLLLSWRVLILPQLEQGELYKQFHLDEPWDSEHNRKLIEKMPAIYSDPDSALRKINAKGQTTFVVPVSEGTVFDRPTGTVFKEITDGTSNTIMFVEVVPERAVVWTKPDDWKVDLDDPLDGVKREDRDWFTAARCDGSVHMISNDVEAKKLRSLLTRAGEEIID